MALSRESLRDRTSGLWRVVAGIVYLPITIILLILFIPIVIVYALIDVIWVLLTKRDSVSRGLLGRLVARVWDWLFGNVEWILLGRGRFEWIP